MRTHRYPTRPGVRRLAVTVMVATFALVGAACGGGSADETEDGVKRVTFAGNLPTPPGATFFAVPKALGYFEDAGIEVTHQVTKGTIEGVQAVLAGKADFALGGTSAAIASYATDPQLRIVSTFTSNYRIIVKDQSPIRSTADLRGKKIGAQALASGSYQFGRAFVSEAGLDPDKDVTFLPVGVGAQAAQSLRSDDVDAYITYTGAGEEVVRVAGGAFRSVESPLNEMPGTTSWITTQDFLDKNPDAVTGFLEAQYKAAVYATANPEAAIRMMWDEYPDSKPEGDESAALQLISPIAKPGYVDAASHDENGVFGTLKESEFQEVADIFKKYGLIEKSVKMADMVDFSFAAAASKKVDIPSLEAEAAAAK